jgi:hypothetical protein
MLSGGASPPTGTAADAENEEGAGMEKDRLYRDMFGIG